MDNQPPMDWTGTWAGTSRLYFEGKELDSASTARVAHLAQGQFVSLAYTWQADGQPQDGQIIYPVTPGEASSAAVWLDSWHMSHQIMQCKATLDPAGRVSLLGSYSFPGYPTWGWRIEIGLGEDDALTVRMFNIPPDEGEQIAVLAQYTRTPPAR